MSKSERLNCASAANEVHNDGYHCKDEQQMNEKAANVQNKKAT